MTDVESGETSLRIRRTFDASRERVFRAFVDPEEISKWFAPGDRTPDVHALDLEVGGTLSLSFVGEDAQTDIEGTYEEVVENECIVHTWNYPGEAESRVTYEFSDADDGTEVVLVHEGIGPYRDHSSRENVDGYAEGWQNALDKLGVTLRGGAS